MGRLLIIAGILIIVAGAVGFGAQSVLAPVQLASNAVQLTQQTEDTSNLCNPGETLIEQKGASQYTPGTGYGSSVRYFCEDANGERRNVTGQFATSLLGGMGSLFNFNIRFEFAGLIGVGLLVLLAGLGLARRRATSAAEPAVGSGTPTGASPVIRVQKPPTGTPNLNSFLEQPHPDARWQNPKSS